MLRAGFVCAILLVGASASAQESCVRTDNTCIRSGDVNVGGITIEDACTYTKIEERCERDAPRNECVPFARAAVTHGNDLDDGQCRLTSSECVSYRDGECDRNRYFYTCWNGPLEHDLASLEDRVFHNFEEDVLDNCGSLEGNANCTRQTDTITEDYETRTFNGRDVTRAWWARARQYDCTNPAFEDTCGPFDGNPVCTKSDDELCLEYAPDGTCNYAEYTYDCDVSADFEASCEAINVCVGDNCLGLPDEASQDFPKAAAWLNVLDNMSDDFGCGGDGDVIDPETGEISLEACPVDPALLEAYEPELFSGRLMNCNRGSTNCCDFDGAGFCGQESLDLAEFRQAKVTHFVSKECTSEVFGICLSVKENYCVYNSKFARVFQEQAHAQTGVQFGNPDGPNPCPALDVYQLESLDVDAMDFSEVFGEMLDQIDVPIEGELTDRLTGGITDFAPEVQDVFD